MRKLILTFVLGTLCLGAFSQEAFYIYRNDGDFNGFFYDEVVEMRQSKIGVDSVEYDRWVTQEVVLADTIYRIPLAAIDSIGFQQPEIKLNPKVKFMERDGLSPYFVGMDFQELLFRSDMPVDLIPQVGDVIVGLKSDSIAATKYNFSFGELDYGSFSCVVTYVGHSAVNPNYISVAGHPVDKIGDLFEQYITVEEIGIDSANNVHRRVAGCDENGFPRRVAQIAKENGGKTIIDFEGTLSREWLPSENSKVDFSAQVGLLYKMRAAYNITWTRIYIKLTHEINISVKPSIGISVSQGFEIDPWYIIGLPTILFPAACPILETDPFPEIFFRAQGTMEARFNMPKVNIGIANDIIIDSRQLLPVWMTLHSLPDESTKVPDDMLDRSGSVKFSGMVQTGIKFSSSVKTASWFKKVLKTEVGLFLYTGPKISGEISLSTNDIDTYGYGALSNAHLDLSLLSLDLEAKATIDVAWQETIEKTFFTWSKEFMKESIVFVPGFDSTTVKVQANEAVVRIYAKPCRPLFVNGMKAGVDKVETLDASNFHALKPMMTVGDWPMYNTAAETYEARIPLDGLNAFQFYSVYPIVDCSVFGTFKLDGYAKEFWIPTKTSLNNNSIHFSVNGKNNPSIAFTTNVKREEVARVHNIVCNGPAYYMIDSLWLDTINKDAGQYKIVFRGTPNDALFNYRNIDASSKDAPYFMIPNGIDTGYIRLPFGISQDANPLRNMHVKLNVGCDVTWSGNGCPDEPTVEWLEFDDKVSVSRSGDNVITMSGTTQFEEDTRTINLTLTRNQSDSSTEGQSYEYTVSGSVTYTSAVNGTTHTYKSFTFNNVEGSGRNAIKSGYNAISSINHWWTWDSYYYDDNNVLQHESGTCRATKINNDQSSVSITFSFDYVE